MKNGLFLSGFVAIKHRHQSIYSKEKNFSAANYVNEIFSSLVSVHYFICCCINIIILLGFTYNLNNHSITIISIVHWVPHENCKIYWKYTLHLYIKIINDRDKSNVLNIKKNELLKILVAIDLRSNYTKPQSNFHFNQDS